MGRLRTRLPGEAWAVLLVVVPYLIYVFSAWHRIPLAGTTPIGQTDPDTWLRLTLVRDWLMGGSWYEHLVHRSNAPDVPIASPWTRPLDMVIAWFAYLQPETVDLSLRLMRAGLLLPVLWMGLLLLGMQRAVRAVMPLPQAAFMVVVMAMMLPALWNYFTLGNADHHALLAVLFVWAMVGVLTPEPSPRQMVLSGMLFGIQLWVSVEALVLIAVVYGWYGCQWLRGDSSRTRSLAILATSAAVAAFVALGIERPMAMWRMPIYDSISIAHGFVLTLAALLAWVLHVLRPAAFKHRLMLALGLGFVALGGVGLTFPKLLLGPMVDASPFILSQFLPHITEARPFYRISAWTLMATTFIPWLAIILCAAPWLAPKRAFYTKQEALPLLVFSGATLMLYYAQQRWSYYMLPMGIITVAPLLGSLFVPDNHAVAWRWPVRELTGLGADAQAHRRLPIVLAVLATPFLLLMAELAIHTLKQTPRLANTPQAVNTRATEERNACYEQARVLIRSGQLVAMLGKHPLTVLTSTDLGTEILFFTPYRIVASNYHREGEGLAYVWGAEALSDARLLRAHLATRRVDVLLLCPQAVPKKGSLLNAYAYGKPLPAWLRRLDHARPANANLGATKPPSSPHPLLLRVLAG